MSTFHLYVKPNLHRGEKIEYLNLFKHRQRDLKKIPKVIKYIEEHGVYISCTSSPTRLRKITTVLSLILMNKYVRKIFICLPRLYRNKEKYSDDDIKFVKSISNKVEIIRNEIDIGPSNKIVPAIENIKDGKSIIISMDDDIGYPVSLINELIYYSVMYPKQVITGGGFIFGDYDNSNYDRKKWSIKRKPKYPFVDVVEGWCAIAYRKELFDVEMLMELINIDTKCKLSDDFIISYMLGKNKVKMRSIQNIYYNPSTIYSFKYGFLADALHQTGNVSKDVEDANMIRYQECLEKITSQEHT
jgi:hypothetical protein